MDILAIVGIFLMLWVIIGIHEFGHLFAARKCGVGVEEFSIGFGPKLLQLSKKGHIPVYLRALPLGGFVKIKGEKGKESPSPDIPGENIQDVSLGKQIFISAAGVGFNLVFALIIGSILFIFAPGDISISIGARQLIFPEIPNIATALLSNFLYVFGTFIKGILIMPLAIWHILVSPVSIVSPAEHGAFSGWALLGENIHLGIWSYLGLIYLVSIAIAIFNILPLAPLDGGHVAIALLKKIFGSKRKTFTISSWIVRYGGLAILGILIFKLLVWDFYSVTVEHNYKGLMLISAMVMLLLIKYALSKIRKKKES